jgi:hypothetical protein
MTREERDALRQRIDERRRYLLEQGDCERIDRRKLRLGMTAAPGRRRGSR